MIKLSVKLCLILIMLIGFSANGQVQKYDNLAIHSTRVALNGIYDSRKTVFETNTTVFLDAINMAYRANQQPTFPESVVSTELDKLIKDLWAVSPFLSVNTEIIENILITKLGFYEVRNLQIIVEKADPGYEQQDAVLVFDKYGKLIDFKIALDSQSITAILRDTVSVTDLRRRERIISFVEDFRTSYNLMDIDFLEKAFSDKAVIITGRVLQKTDSEELKPTVQYRRQTKEEYILNLRSLFSRSKFISVNYDSLTVVQHPVKTNLYGVTLTQSWNSEFKSGGQYRDIGYVFLIIDFTKEELPKIWVRTWQDKKYVPYDHGVFSFNHFNIK